MILDTPEVTYRLPVNLEFVAVALSDESPDMIFYIDLLTGGVFSLRRREDYDWERVGEGFDHEIDCGFRTAPERFLSVAELSAREKMSIIQEFTETLRDQTLEGLLRRAALGEKPFSSVLDVLGGRPVELCAWRAHLGQACLVAAAEFLEEHGISNEPTQCLSSDQEFNTTLFVN